MTTHLALRRSTLPAVRAPAALRAPASLLAALAALALSSASADAQYFGRNKVQYERFDFRIMRTDHLDFYFYPAESLATADAARMGERWYSRLSEIFRHTFDRKSVVMYADHPDFQQTNVVSGSIEEGTGGITEGLRTRVVMPHTGSYWDTDHVLGHELVHVFQYNVAESGPGGLARLSALPLWLVEGMAEYLSLGRYDPLTAMWLRDATLRNKLPTIKQLTTDPRFFPYRYGQALWAYIGGRYGDRAVIDVYRASLRMGWDQALVRILGVSSDSLSKDWIASIKAHYTPLMEGRQRPREAGNVVIGVNKNVGDYNLAPTVSPDGRYVAFFSGRGLFSIDLYVADAQTGRIIKRLASPQTSSHIDAISSISSSGAWSPDGRQFAFIVFAQGDHEIALLDVRSADVVRRIKLSRIGAVNNVAWSPDGRTLALSGMAGGISDIYLLDIASGSMRQLTNDRYADIHPSWSPDGRTIAFASDRGPRTSFDRLSFSPMQIATADVATGQVSVYAPFPNAKHINPVFSRDGRDIFFISDRDGFSDIYRLTPSTGDVTRLTNVATGVSGITHTSPAMSISWQTGALYFSVFEQQGFDILTLPANRTAGQPIAPAAVAAVPVAGILPPGDTPGRAPVTSYLADATSGLPAETSFPILPYKPRFSLDAIGQPSLGVASGPFGTGVAGGVSAFFGDQLGDQMIGTAIQAQGTVQDIGGQVVYYNLKRRFNWGAGISHIPYLTGYAYVGPSQISPQLREYNLVLQRLFFTEASLIGQYPFSTTRRVEASISANRIGYSQEIQTVDFDPITGASGNFRRTTGGGPPPLAFGQGSIALVGDRSNAAFTSPVAGVRYRFEAQPTFGQITFNTALADYRRYLFMRPITLAWRGIHYGRYGQDAENFQVISPLFLGEEQLIRGYSYNSFSVDECTNSQSTSSCPVFERLIGSRMAVFNAELRIPLIGTPEFGLLNIPFLPVELSPFFDAGLMWTSDQNPSFRFKRSDEAERPASCSQQSRNYGLCAERVPVFSTGLSTRVNLLGYLIFEIYYAKPFQRPAKDWVWGFQLAPGW